MVAPFSNIRDAETCHIEALLTLYTLYELLIPANPWAEKTPHYVSLQEVLQQRYLPAFQRYAQGDGRGGLGGGHHQVGRGQA